MKVHEIFAQTADTFEFIKMIRGGRKQDSFYQNRRLIKSYISFNLCSFEWTCCGFLLTPIF